MVRIGVVNLDTSHPIAFGRILMEQERARYVAVYNDGFRTDEEVERFMRAFGVERRCKTVAELAEMSDIGFIQGCNWDRHLDYVQPFLKANKPVFIDKPMIGSLRDCRRLEALAAQGLRVLGSSSLQYAREIVDFLRVPVSERGEIVHVFGTCGTDEFNYGVHVVAAINGLLQGAVSCRHCGEAVVQGVRCNTYTVAFAGGQTASYNAVDGPWLNNQQNVTTTKAVFSFRVDTGNVYRPMLERIVRAMETGEHTLAPLETLLETIQIMLAGKASRGADGAPVRLDALREDGPSYDGAAFEAYYAAQNSPIYRNL